MTDELLGVAIAGAGDNIEQVLDGALDLYRELARLPAGPDLARAVLAELDEQDMRVVLWVLCRVAQRRYQHGELDAADQLLDPDDPEDLP